MAGHRRLVIGGLICLLAVAGYPYARGIAQETRPDGPAAGAPALEFLPEPHTEFCLSIEADPRGPVERGVAILAGGGWRFAIALSDAALGIARHGVGEVSCN